MPASWIAQPPRGPDGRPSEAAKQAVEEVDQWTVGALGTVRPLFKYSWPDGQQVYVNGNTGEVVQYTTTASRFWAYLGAIPHWLYFTPLRKHQAEWFSFVVWSSLIGTIAALMGLVIIVWMYSPRKRYRHAGAPTSIPYRGWKRWHAIVGLFFGVVTTTWAFSGLLSMGPFPIMNRLTELTVPAPDRRRDAAAADRIVNGALRGARALPLSAYAAAFAAPMRLPPLPTSRSRSSSGRRLPGEPLYLATERPRRDAGDSDAGRTQADARSGGGDARRARRDRRELAELRMIDEYDAYYLDRHRERPLPVDLRAPERRRRHAVLHRPENRPPWSASTARAAG